jgi:hypothetical protein
MNPDEMQRMMEQGNRMMDGLLVGPLNFPIRAMMWSQSHPEAAWALAVIYLTIWLQAIWHCLSSCTGADRTTWLILLLFLPFFGVLFYWALANRTERHADLSLYSSPPPPPAPRTTRSIAEEITADLAKRKRP